MTVTGVAVDVGVLVAVLVAVFVAVRVSVLVGVFVKVAVDVLVKVAMAVALGVDVLVAVTVSVEVGAKVLVTVAVTVAVKVGVGVAALTIVPGEPVSLLSFTATNAPFTPTTLSCEIVVLFRPAALSKLAYGLAGDAPKLTLACSSPLPLNRFTASPLELRPMPLPV